MRLINTSTLALKEFLEGDIPPYAILSHTWGNDEVSFQDIQNLDALKGQKGLEKIKGCCDQTKARDPPLEWAWVDTCCINKESSAELSEAINSMFRWYANSEVCFAYLSDVPNNLDDQGNRVAYKASKWFTRGWTLQELIAPRQLIFFNNAWIMFGSKVDLRDVISERTGIDKKVILSGEMAEVSIAKRMSWASERKTTRMEDTAYCLMGIFDVHMPLLYGEGLKAFIRLQEEIMKNSDDHSLFCWRTTQESETIDKTRGMLASSPAEFASTGDVIPLRLPELQRPELDVPYSMTNRDLQITLEIFPWPGSLIATAHLPCVQEQDTSHLLTIDLQGVTMKGNQFYRINPTKLGKYQWRTETTKTILKTIYIKDFKISSIENSMRLRTLPPSQSYELSKVSPDDPWVVGSEKLRIRNPNTVNKAQVSLSFS